MNHFHVARDQRGMTLAELMVSIGLTALVLGLTVFPMVQMKKIEQRIVFQSGVDSAHSISLQQARNSSWVKTKIRDTSGGDLTISGSPIDKCFSGYGTGCGAFIVNNVVIEKTDFNATSGAGTAATAEIRLTVLCAGTSCSKVMLDVKSEPTGVAIDGRPVRRLVQQIVYAPKTLSTRPEIDFSGCAGKVITGIDFKTLKAICDPISGNNTCQGVGSGPMTVFGQAISPAACQNGANETCPAGTEAVGLISGQTQCVATYKCVDPFSPVCTPVPPPPCVPIWAPSPATVCAGAAFMQTAFNCFPNPTQAAVGTMVCNGPCTYSGALNWTQVNPGQCENPLVTVADVPPATRVIDNTKLGVKGTFTAQCIDNTAVPLPNAYDMPAAVKVCQPVTCTVPATVEWSSAGLKSAVAGPGFDPVGPWPCSGPVNLVQIPGAPASQLFAVELDPSAYATANNTAATATSGTAKAICRDPGPASNTGRVGNWEVTVSTCNAKACGPADGVPTPVMPAPADLCLDGSTPPVDGTSPLMWRWNCGPVGCSAPKPPPGCGVAQGKYLTAIPGAPDLCSDGSGVVVTTSALPPPLVGAKWDWKCGAADCTASELVCGSSGGVTVSTAPTANFCNDPAKTFSLAGAGPWSWTCGLSACNAYAPPAICGPHGGKYFDLLTPPANPGLCDDLSSPAVNHVANGWNWTCGGNTCTALEVICSPTLQDKYVSSKPVAGLCNDPGLDAVVAPTVAGTNPWTWSCGSKACNTSGCFEWQTVSYTGSGVNSSPFCDGGFLGRGTGTATAPCGQGAALNEGVEVTCCDSGADCYKQKCVENVTGVCTSEVVCGPQAGGNFGSTPTNPGLCSDGSTPLVTLDGSGLKYTWGCGARSCSANFSIGCGSADGGTFPATPVANLCSDSSLPPVTASSGQYTWNCGTEPCTATRTPGTCSWRTTSPPAYMAGQNFALEGDCPPYWSGGSCAKILSDFHIVGGVCEAANVGATISGAVRTGPWNGAWTGVCGCTAPPVATCGASHLQVMTSAPTTDLCSDSSMPPVTESGSPGSKVWSWSCDGTGCSATEAPDCGSAHTQTLTAAPTTNLCNDGSTPPVTTNAGPTSKWTWMCGTKGCRADASSSCAPANPVDFYCDTWDGKALYASNQVGTSGTLQIFNVTTAPAPPDAYSCRAEWDTATCTWACCKQCKYADLHECHACANLSATVCAGDPIPCPAGYHPNGNACAADGLSCNWEQVLDTTGLGGGIGPEITCGLAASQLVWYPAPTETCDLAFVGNTRAPQSGWCQADITYPNAAWRCECY